MSTTTTQVDAPSPPFPRRTPLGRFASLARRAWQAEVGVWVSLYRLVFARPRVPRGAVAIPYHRPVTGILITFIVLSAIEIPIIDLIVHPWPLIRIPLLVLGIWGLTWMLGYLFGYLTRPHAVGPGGIRIRQGAEFELALTWDDIASVARRSQITHDGPKFTPGRSDEAWVLHLRMQDETNLIVRLEYPVEVRMPQGVVRVDEVRFWADDPTAFLDAARPHLEAA